jgi:plasmid maintenance system antidote protein VapI
MKNLSPGIIEEYNPNQMLDTLIQYLNLEDDSALAHTLKVAPRMITKLREGRILISETMLIWMRDVSGMKLQELRSLLKDKRIGYRLTCK